MSLKIVRNDITKMEVDAIVNTANEDPVVGDGCDTAVYNAAGRENLLALRKLIGHIDEGEAAITPGLALPAKCIIHAVSPLYVEGDDEVEGRLRNCYKNSFKLALENGIKSIAFSLISTGSFGYPKEEGMRIAIDEINGFLMQHDMDVYLVVFDGKMTDLGRRIDTDLESYIDERYMNQLVEEEYGYSPEEIKPQCHGERDAVDRTLKNNAPLFGNRSKAGKNRSDKKEALTDEYDTSLIGEPQLMKASVAEPIRESGFKDIDAEIVEDEGVCAEVPIGFDDEVDSLSLDEHLKHLSDTFSEYLLYLIQSRGMKNSDVYKKALVDKKVFSKIKNDHAYQPSKITAMCLCIGAQLNLDQSRDLLARAGYALSPANKTDVIFSYFIEKKIYDMIELDIQLEEHGEKCLIP